MDPLAHTLLGATLAESGLKRRSRYATATLLIGANLPDIDAVANLWGADAALHSRRGVTHGVIAMRAPSGHLIGCLFGLTFILPPAEKFLYSCHSSKGFPNRVTCARHCRFDFGQDRRRCHLDLRQDAG